MKVIRSSLGFIVCFCLLTLFACNKYPEGPKLSIHRKEIRVKGYYKVVSLTVDGADSTAEMTSNPVYACNYDTYPIVFPLFTGDSARRPCKFIIQDETWALSDDKKDLILSFHFHNGDPVLYPLVFNEDRVVTWSIQRLTKWDMWLKTNLNGKEYYLKLEDYGT